MTKTSYLPTQTNNSMIGKKLNLDGDSLVDIFIVRDTTEESHKFYKECCDKVMDYVYPKLVGYLEGLQVAKKCHECQNQADLEALVINQVPDFLFKDIVEKLNEIKEMTDTERLFALAQMGDRLVFSSTQYVEKIMRERMQVILMKPKGPKIIKPSEPRFADKIINPYE